MEIFIERVENPESWDIELESFRGSVFMTRKWIEVISSHERNPLYLRFVNDKEVVAVLAGIQLLNAKGTAKQLFFYSGITAKTKDPELIRKCKLALYEFAKNNNYYRVSMRSYDHISYVPAKLKQFKEKQRTEFITFLDDDKDEIYKSFSLDIIKRARRAKKKGVILKNSYSTSLTEKMLTLLNETYNIRKSKGYGRYSYFFLPFFKHEEINKLVTARHATFYYAEFQNEILSILFIFSCRGRAYGIFQATSLNGYKLGAPAFLKYEVTGVLKDTGYQYYNHGGVPGSLKHKGLRKFKEKIGAEPVSSSEELTNFLTSPLNLLNPWMNLKRVLRNLKIFPSKITNAIIKIIDIILNKRDEY